METITRKKDISFIENIFIKSATILAVRCWDTGDYYELDLHLPQARPENWTAAQRIATRISNFHYCDYTPARWDADTKTCTLFIDGSHPGRGSQWLRTLEAGSPLHYVSIDSVRHAPVEGTVPVFIGDHTAIGHFSALQQLAGREAVTTGFLQVNQAAHKAMVAENCPWLNLHVVSRQEDYYHQLDAYLGDLPQDTKYMFFLAGNSRLVGNTRKFLRQLGIDNASIKAQGFW
ncbi:SIP domain-containing protein [Chitinophaga sp. CB10]|uniref:SIP domain-containing protein n=1 Tax=Chitinophaga sp. CB10 TaxID=1891659 RepID=UPI0025C08C31|nr:SIP domain-containing protein [Chitinophaga sp. CB10]